MIVWALSLPDWQVQAAIVVLSAVVAGIVGWICWRLGIRVRWPIVAVPILGMSVATSYALPSWRESTPAGACAAMAASVEQSTPKGLNSIMPANTQIMAVSVNCAKMTSTWDLRTTLQMELIAGSDWARLRGAYASQFCHIPRVQTFTAGGGQIFIAFHMTGGKTRSLVVPCRE